MARFFRVKNASGLAMFSAALGVLVFGAGASAQTTIDAVVCSSGSESTAVLSLARPESGLVSETPDISVDGTVRDLTQIQVTIDDRYSSTIPINARQTDFSAVISLPHGTHAVKLTGIDICQIKNPAVEFVATYEPAAVKTLQSAETAAPGDTTVGDSGKGQAPPASSPLGSIAGRIGDAGHRLLLALNIISPAAPEQAAAMATRSIAVTAGAAALVWPQALAIADHYGVRVWGFLVISDRRRARFVRAAALIAILGALFI